MDHEPMSRDREYDEQTFEIMKRILKSNSSCIDVGAHRGKVLSRMVAIAPCGKHYAFGPLPQLAKDLKSRFPNVHIYQLALSNGTGVTEFQHIRNGEGYSGIKLRHTPFEPRVEKLVLRMEQLDNIIPREGHISFMKVDVEGAECNVFQGGVETIKRNKPVIVFECGRRALSTYGFCFEDIHRLLVSQCGLRISTMRRWLDGDGAYSKEEFTEHEHRDYMWISYA